MTNKENSEMLLKRILKVAAILSSPETRKGLRQSNAQIPSKPSQYRTTKCGL